MRINFLSFVASLALRSSVDAFINVSVDRKVSPRRQEPSQILRSTATRPEDEVDSASGTKVVGKTLQGGKIIDFESLQGPSDAEHALKLAKEAIVHNEGKRNDGVSMLGINEDVIAEVGHELGSYVNSDEIQDCAAYLRSMSADNFFETRADSIFDRYSNNEKSSTSIAQLQRDEVSKILRQAYAESGEVTSAFAKTFYLGTQLLPEASREATWAIYVWCRRTDEIVDAPRESNDEMLEDLGKWEMRLENIWRYGEVEDVFDLCLLDVLVKYPTLPMTPFVDMIRGMLMDVPELGQDRYESFDDLHLYCYRVAGTVALMCLPVFGCSPGYDENISREPALSLGIAMQLTNILRDVGEDAVTRGRVYLPKEDLQRFGVTEEQLFEQRVDENYVNMMKFSIARARMYYERARRGVFMLAAESRLPVQSSLDAYGRILDKIEKNGYDSLTTRAYVDKWEKLSMIPFSWYRTQDISRSIPLPGDKPIPSLEETP